MAPARRPLPASPAGRAHGHCQRPAASGRVLEECKHDERAIQRRQSQDVRGVDRRIQPARLAHGLRQVPDCPAARRARPHPARSAAVRIEVVELARDGNAFCLDALVCLVCRAPAGHGDLGAFDSARPRQGRHVRAATAGRPRPSTVRHRLPQPSRIPWGMPRRADLMIPVSSKLPSSVQRQPWCASAGVAATAGEGKACHKAFFG
jgi:hypothetical protein